MEALLSIFIESIFIKNMALSFFLGGITGLVGVIINYVKLDDVRNTWVERV